MMRMAAARDWIAASTPPDLYRPKSRDSLSTLHAWARVGAEPRALCSAKGLPSQTRMNCGK